MIKRNTAKLLSLVFALLGNILIFAQLEGGDGPPPPEGVGSPASPIDMYVYVLGILAILLITYYSKKIQRKAI